MKYDRTAREVAKDLVGRVLDVDGLEVRIIETEAYEGGAQTKSRECMQCAPGELGVMPFRGNYFLNIGTRAEGEPSCVLIRAAEVDGELYDGPGKVGKALDASELVGWRLGKDISVKGETTPSSFSRPAEKSDNSKGRYRLK